MEENYSRMFESYPDLLTVPELQSALSLGRSKVYSLISHGDIKSVKIGKTIRIRKPDLVNYVSNLETTVPAGAGLAF